MPTHRIALSCCLIFAVGCAGASAAQQKDLDQAKQAEAVHAELSRELPPLALHPLADDANFFSASVESTQAPEVSTNGGLHQIVIPIGTEQPVRCFVYPKAINLAQTLRLFVNGVASHVTQHQVDAIDAGQAGGVPYLSLGTSYIVEQDGQRTGGQVKYLAARGDNTTTLCMHDEPGYAKTFARIVTGFVASQKFADSAEDPARKLLVWRSVSVQRNGAVSVGVIESRLYEGEAGYAFATSSSILLPAEDGSVVASDAAENQFSNADGDIIEAKYVKIINDSLAYNIGLRFDRHSAYRVTGTVEGSPVETTINVTRALPDFASQSAQLRKLFGGKETQQSIHWATYSPSSPTQMTDVDFEKKADGAGIHAGVLHAGKVNSDVEVDELGMQKRSTTNDVTVERVWQGSHS